MTWFKNHGVGANLLAAFSVVATFTALTGVIGISNMSKINGMNDAMYANELMGTYYVKQANIDLLLAVRDQKNFLMARNDEQRRKYLEEMGKSKSLLKEDLEKVKPLFHLKKGKELLEEADAAIAAWNKVDQKVSDLGLNEKTRSEARLLSIGEARNRINVVDGIIAELSNMKASVAKEASDETARIYKISSLFMISLVAGSVLLAWPWEYWYRVGTGRKEGTGVSRQRVG